MVSTDIILVQIGIFGRPIGFEGDTYLYTNEEIVLKKPSHVFIAIEGLKVPFRVSKFKQNGKELKVRLVGFDTKESVAALKSKEVYCEQQYVTIQEVEEDELIGYKVYREDDYIGDIIDVEDHGLNSLLKVNLLSGSLVYIPFHEDLIIGSDASLRILKMKIAEGLLSL